MSEHPLTTVMKLDPAFMDILNNADSAIYANGALPKKIKLLMAMAFDAAHGAVLGVRSLAQQAMREGATKEEIAETIRVAYQLSGIGSVYTASQGLKDLFD
ncbi:MAG TPA: carboxymuconolactone decarboxylase family protein [Chitinivibrionales bacterium]|jgi:alkylhydroperoxidase/carboxymuconolactone decarboxylase family protein YurZ|nr:carboxymuconolactone decarboxylase family protein [Chitinivibrionales bacterium]